MDNINPVYYKNGIETTKYILSHDLDFCEGNIIKYVTRWKLKNGVEDLLKAKKYLELLIEAQPKIMEFRNKKGNIVKYIKKFEKDG